MVKFIERTLATHIRKPIEGGVVDDTKRKR